MGPPLAAHEILWHRGEHHKKQRKMLNPVFSTNHLRDMLPIFYEISYKVLQLRLFLSRRYKSSLLN
jgi:cytochrome P450